MFFAGGVSRISEKIGSEGLHGRLGLSHVRADISGSPCVWASSEVSLSPRTLVCGQSYNLLFIAAIHRTLVAVASSRGTPLELACFADFESSLQCHSMFIDLTV